MKLPRLRVRQMIFLVVYAALIGNAWHLSYSGRAVTYPSSVPGFLWAPVSDVDVRVIPRVVVNVRAKGAAFPDGKASSLEFNALIEFVNESNRNPDMAEGTWLLVAEDAVK